MKVNRAWAMPNKYTFKIKPIAELLKRYEVGDLWADPFCGESSLCQYRNDLNPENQYAITNLKSTDFLKALAGDFLNGVVFDPPYSPRQISECYKSIGLKVNKKDTQNQWTEDKKQISRILKKDGIVITFGWNSNGMGKKYGFEIIEILLVAHGSAHNDTICTVERKL